jgi:N6-adenosine-specific RNA methylase IME4
MMKYRTIIVDPPWDYPDGFNGWGIRRALPYPALSLGQIAALPLPELLAREGYLFLWVTNRHLPSAFALISQWSFTYRQTLTWDKGVGSGGLGGMFATTSEFVIIAQNIGLGTHAHGPRTNRVRHSESVLRFARQRNHSQKPDAFFALIETLAPGPYLELFARRKRLGWHSWGDEVVSDIKILLDSERESCNSRKNDVPNAYTGARESSRSHTLVATVVGARARQT